MGWFDDNHPNGQAAEDEMMEMFGPGKWQKDTPKASGSSSRTPKRIERPGAEWDPSKWRRSNFRDDDTCHKTRAKSFWLLTDSDLMPLEWRMAMNSRGFHNMKEYRTKEVEAASWAKHGGPAGLKAAKAEAKDAKDPSKKASKKFKTIESVM